MQETSKFKFKLAEGTDYFAIDDFNYNSQSIYDILSHNRGLQVQKLGGVNQRLNYDLHLTVPGFTHVDTEVILFTIAHGTIIVNKYDTDYHITSINQESPDSYIYWLTDISLTGPISWYEDQVFYIRANVDIPGAEDYSGPSSYMRMILNGVERDMLIYDARIPDSGHLNFITSVSAGSLIGFKFFETDMVGICDVIDAPSNSNNSSYESTEVPWTININETGDYSVYAGSTRLTSETAYQIKPDEVYLLFLNHTDTYKWNIFKLTPNEEGGGYTPDIPLVTWADGSDEDISVMVFYADEGELDLTEYWSIGDERAVSLASMSKTYYPGSNTHEAQNVKFVLMDTNHYNLTTPIEEKTQCSFVVGQKNCLIDPQFLHYNSSGSYPRANWSSTLSKTWCDDIYYNAMPETFRSLFKTFDYKYTLGEAANDTVDPVVADCSGKIAFFAAEEIVTSSSWIDPNAWEYYSQIEYYKTESHRLKNNGESEEGTVSRWWTRSGVYSSRYNNIYAYINESGQVQSITAAQAYYVAPFGVI